ncbi:hypothetical protein RCF98_09860 [Thiothrix lacustris]|jgi:hypothetical protein|uniref:Secreted protein n=1 Tax=Thiothrix lacustris TaxID=525917 RepID=A0ABY9ML38_9GAMM|nr:hypothetical protein [Thiothrix lacustris]WML89278.1 hypothetical protein RCF98_09860 [Thiothrix lacustris]
MIKPITLSGALLLVSVVSGCATPAPEMTQAQAEINRQYVDQIDESDRNRAHVERMREVEAIERINQSSPSLVIIK